MLSETQIVRLLEAEDYRHLVERILCNGRCRSVVARRTLTRPQTARLAALGLGLQRLCELAYRARKCADGLADRLLAAQRLDGLFADEGASIESKLAVSGAALRGLIMWIDLNRMSGRSVDRAASDAIARGFAALAERFGGGIDVHTDAVGWAIVLWQLGDVPTFRRALPVEDLLALLDESQADLMEDELSRFAQAMAA